MRIHILAGVAFLLTAESLLAQGQILFHNRVAGVIEAPIFGPDPADPSSSRHGNTVGGTPPGSQTYFGSRLAGSGYSAQLFGGATGSPGEALSALGPATVFKTGGNAGYVVPPAFALTVPGVAEGQSARIQLRVWENRDGSVSSWEQVLSDPTLARGASLPFLSAPLGGVLTLPPNLVGLESFNLAVPVPEPAVVALLLFGAVVGRLARRWPCR